MADKVRRLESGMIACSLAAALAIVGCQGRESDVPTAELPVQPQAQQRDDADKLPASDPRRAVALKAKDALFEQLSARLKQVLQSGGPAAAIEVCSQEAVKIAESVGREHGVAIGRTSFKLRNPDNAPRDWVRPFVEKQTDTPQHIGLDDGSLGALFPIRLDVKCLMCHGQPDEMLDDVKLELAKRYPDDAATGFKQGDLRGWFWVEVPSP
jgi:uncharacterized lipoprotein YmbA